MPTTRRSAAAHASGRDGWEEGDPVASESDDPDFYPETEAEAEAADYALAVALMNEGSGEEGAESEEGGDGAGVNVLEAFFDANEGGDDDDNDDDDDEIDGNDGSDADARDASDGDDDEEEEMEEEEEEEVEVEVGGRRRTAREVLFALLNSGQHRMPVRPSAHLPFTRSLPIPPEPLKNDLVNDIRIRTSPEDPRLSITPASPPTPQQAAHRGPTCSPTSPAGGGAAALRLRRTRASPSSPAVQPVLPLQPVLPVLPVTPREMLRRREVGRAGEGLKKAPGGLTLAQCSHMCAFAALPTKPVRVIDRHHSSCYTARFSPDGNKFVAGFQGQHIRMYDAHNQWSLFKDVEAVYLRWTITDTALSHDQRHLLYATIDSTVYVCTLEASGQVRSVSNMTDVHDNYNFDILEGETADRRRRHGDGTGIWAIRWSGDGREIIAGTSNNSVYVFDIEKQRTVAVARGHHDHVNAVAYLDPQSQNIIASGSDDAYIKVWDRRVMGRNCSEPVGVLPGHTEGLTYLDPRGDDRYFISNSKDQSVKLWDLRNMAPPCYGRSDEDSELQEKVMLPDYDYRHHEYPPLRQRVPAAVIHPNDRSIQTYRGHSVTGTLIRAYLSPLETTGQRFIYAGSYDGDIHIWDVVSGQQVTQLKLHQRAVRDLSWSPTEAMMVSTSFDGTIVEWRPEAYSDKALKMTDLGVSSRGYRVW